MIGRLQGVMVEKSVPWILIDIQGVCYEVEVSLNTFYQLPEIGIDIILYTHFIVREDAQLLYGFYDVEERGMFRALIKINGVGPKLALAILSGMGSHELVQSIQDSDVNRLTKLPGVGKKTAERLIIEMRDKVKFNVSNDKKQSTNTFQVNSVQGNKVADNIKDAISALISLGYKASEASQMIQKIAAPESSSEEMIKLALKMALKSSR